MSYLPFPASRPVCSLLVSLGGLLPALGLCSAVDPTKADGWEKHGKHLVVPVIREKWGVQD